MFIKQKILVSFSIIIFFIGATIPFLTNEKEPWPFSYFGMYKGTLNSFNVCRMRILAYDKDNNEFELFRIGAIDYFHITRRTEQTLIPSTREDIWSENNLLFVDPHQLSSLRSFYESTLHPYLEKYDQQKDIKKIVVLWQRWEHFKPNINAPPTNEFILMAATVNLSAQLDWIYPNNQSTDSPNQQ
jgi:hypothetical protein